MRAHDAAELVTRYGAAVERFLSHPVNNGVAVTDKDPLVPNSREEGHLTPSVLPPEAVEDITGVAEGLRKAEWGIPDNQVGGVIDTADGSASNLARYVATAPTSDELFMVVERINKSVQAAIRLERLP